MATEQPLDVLFAHDRWATEQMLQACEPLGDEALDRPFAMGRGSLRGTLVHILDVVDAWDSRINQREEHPVGDRAPVAGLLDAHRRIYDAFAATCRGRDLGEVLHLQRFDRKLTIPRGAVLTHILTHGTHHRAQALNMLRHLGVSPLPSSSVFEWTLATGQATLS